jgi:hypothetical protein
MAYFPRVDAKAAESAGRLSQKRIQPGLLTSYPDFRRVLWTGEHSQLVTMTSKHTDTDLFLYLNR